jgi:tRNA (guanine9-N1)-methyltransferase
LLFNQICLKNVFIIVNDGFERYIIEKSDRTLQEDYPTELHKLVYLTPDSQNILETLDIDNKIYVLGGLVDETVSKKVTYDKCENLKISTVRLPIEEYMSRQKNNSKFNFSKVLSINQVFGILLKFSESNDWKLALGHGVPKRKGYFVENIPQNNDVATSTENSEPQANDNV